MSRLRKLELSGVVSTDNSSSAILGAGIVFPGVSEDVTDFGTVEISVYSDVASATDGLSIQFSADGTNWDHTDVYTVPAATGKSYSVQRVAKFLRVVYTNGAAPQTEFRLQVILNQFYIKPSSHRIQDSITDDDDATLTTTVLKVAGGDPEVFDNVDVQHPMPADGDSVYLKDIDVANSDNGGFSGTITDYFDSLKTVNNDASVTNPKVIKIWFNRSLQTNSIGFGCDDLTKSFSNIKIEALGSGEEVRYTKDLSADSTKRNSYVVDLPPLALNGVTISFYTADEVGLSNLIIWKSEDVNARLAAVSSLTGDVENIGSFRGTLSVNQALVHKVGISEYFKRDIGGSTTIAVAATAGDTSIDVVSTAGLAILDDLRLYSTTMVERSHYTITNIVGTVLTLNRPIDNDLAIGDFVVEIDIRMNKLGTLATPIVYRIQPPSYERWQITRFLISMLDSTIMDDGKFGGATALANSLVIRTVINGDISTLTHWNTNQDLKDDMYDVDYATKAPAGTYGLSGRWTLTQSQYVSDLDGATGDYLEILVQDDLTVLDDFKIKAQGRLFGG